MTVTSEFVQGDRHLIRYLLGLLPEEEAERLDERSIVDDALAARLRDLENELVDAYVTGTLEAGLRGPFESFYMASPRRREKVRFAERFLPAVDRAAGVDRGVEAARAPDAGRAQPAAASPAPGRSPVGWVLALAAVLAIACGVLLIRNLQLRRLFTVAQRESAAQAVRSATLAAQVDAQRAESERTAASLARARAAQPAAAFALVLPPQTRGAGPIAGIAIAPGARTVDIDLQLDVDRFPRYEVAVKDPATDRIVWRSEPLMPDRMRRPPALGVVLPASVLKAQHYSIELSARGADGSAEAVGSYAFRVEPR